MYCIDNFKNKLKKFAQKFFNVNNNGSSSAGSSLDE